MYQSEYVTSLSINSLYIEGSNSRSDRTLSATINCEVFNFKNGQLEPDVNE